MIEIRGLHKTYFGKNKIKTEALKDIFLSLPENGFVFVLGKSGSGKSTLLNLLGDLDDPTSGDILINGKSLFQFTNKEKR